MEVGFAGLAQTGDPSPIPLIAGIVVAALAVLVVAFVFMRRK